MRLFFDVLSHMTSRAPVTSCHEALPASFFGTLARSHAGRHPQPSTIGYPQICARKLWIVNRDSLVLSQLRCLGIRDRRRRALECFRNGASFIRIRHAARARVEHRALR